jgi:pilus assembly protein Flp/PilA
MKKFLANLWHDEEGQGMVEYGLILALIAIAVIAILGTMGDNIRALFQRTSDTMEGALDS